MSEEVPLSLPDNSLQVVADYYRNKSNQLELEFIQYQLAAQATIADLHRQLQEHLSAHAEDANAVAADEE